MAIHYMRPKDFGIFLSEEIRKAARRALHSAALRAVQYITTELIPQVKPHEPVDRGAYRAGWRVKKTERGADIINTLPYAPIIEYGARPENIKIGHAMISALSEWARRKGIAGPEPGDATRIAFAIATAMKTKGIYNQGRGLRILEQAVAKIPAFLDEEFAREVKKIE